MVLINGATEGATEGAIEGAIEGATKVKRFTAAAGIDPVRDQVGTKSGPSWD